MHLVLLVFKSNWRLQKESCMALKLIWKLVNTVAKEGPEVYRMVSSASDIIDVYREESQPENWTLWYPHRDCQRSEQQALRFDTLNYIREVVGEPGVAIIWETKAVESANKNVVIDRVESLGQVDEYCCTVMSLIDGAYDVI